MWNILRLTDLTIVKARSPRSCARLLKWGVPRRAFRRVHRSSLTKDNRRSPKRKENWRKSLLLGIQTGNKLAKTPFFVAYSRLYRHCRNLAEGGCLSSRFHFTLCRYFLGHVACPNLPGRASWLGQLDGFHDGQFPQEIHCISSDRNYRRQQIWRNLRRTNWKHFQDSFRKP